MGIDWGLMMESKMSPAVRRDARLGVCSDLPEAIVWLFRCICVTVGFPGLSDSLPSFLAFYFQHFGGNGLSGDTATGAFSGFSQGQEVI